MADSSTTRLGRRSVTTAIAVGLLIGLIWASTPAWGQGIGGSSSSTSTSSSQGDGPEPTAGPPLSVDQGAFNGSVPEGKAMPEVLQISFDEAINRGLRNNLGLLLQSDNTLTARGQRWKELSNLLPNLNATISENVLQTDLQAEGLRFPGFPKVIGPFGFFDARANLTQSVFDWHSIQRERGTVDRERAAHYSYKDARDLVVLAVGNTYLLAIAQAARVETAQAQVQTSQALYDKAVDQQKAGVTPAIDTLRSQVELQTLQQQLIVARNNYAKQKLALARVIGLPPGQEFVLTEKAPYAPLTAQSIEENLQRAYTSRSDYLAAVQQVRAAEHFRAAATAEHYPSLGIAANYGDIGVTPGESHGTFSASGTVTIPIFQGGKAHADVLQAEASLRQARQQLGDLRGRIDYEVRTALLDLAAAADQVEVARSSVQLAQETLTQARDRFVAGVTDNLEVVQAQESVASANEAYISSLYAYNVGKVSLARAIGFAEQGVRQYLQSR
jgi:outer membrane protein TolC